MSDLWEAVPQVRWSGRVDQPVVPQKAEPSVTANVAATADAAKPDPTVNGTPEQPLSSTLAKASTTSEANHVQTVSDSKDRGDPTTASEVAVATVSKSRVAENESLEPTTPQAVFADPSLDQIERLKAALNDDAERAKSSPSHASTTPEVRVRVESMVTRARHLFDLGKLREARQAAKSAHDLGDSARLDYSPDEERPIDLVQRIDDQLREAAQPTEAAPQQTAGLIDDRGDPKAVAAITVGQPDPRTLKGSEIDSGGRPRRDWSLNVFRRDRKTSPLDPGPTPPGIVVINSASAVQSIVEADAISSRESDSAIVQANRSLTLVKAQASPNVDRQPRDSSTPIAYAPFQRAGETSEELLDSTTGDAAIAKQPPEIDPLPATWPAAIALPPRIIVDEPTNPPADVEEVKPIVPFRDVAGRRSHSIQQPEGIENAPAGNWSWLIGVAIFAACAVVAIFWYRRGAI